MFGSVFIRLTWHVTGNTVLDQASFFLRNSEALRTYCLAVLLLRSMDLFWLLIQCWPCFIISKGFRIFSRSQAFAHFSEPGLGVGCHPLCWDASQPFQLKSINLSSFSSVIPFGFLCPVLLSFLVLELLLSACWTSRLVLCFIFFSSIFFPLDLFDLSYGRFPHLPSLELNFSLLRSCC